MNYLISGACLSVVGKVRNNNEDNFFFDNKNLSEQNNGSKYIYKTQFNNINNKIFAVFDGMGGESKGERASYIASTVLREYSKEYKNQELDWNQFVKIANNSICEEMYGKDRMGTTMAGIQFCEKYMTMSNIGDSRIYILSDRSIYQVSKDHTEAYLQTKLNIKTNKKARLTQYLGVRNEEMIIQPFIRKFDYTDIDKIIICSDGITDMLTNNEIQNILLQNQEVEVNVDNLVEKAMEKGGVDNTTVMVFKVLPCEKEKIEIQKTDNIIDKIKNIFSK